MLLPILVCAAAAIPNGNSLLATNKLSLASWGSYNQRNHRGYGTYSYGYNIEDPVTGNVQFRQEERHANGTVFGSYGYVDANGQLQVTNYVSDINGYRVVKGGQNGFATPAPPQHGQSQDLPLQQLFYPSDTNKNVAGIYQQNRVHNPPPILYQLQVPLLTYHRANLPFFYKRK